MPTITIVIEVPEGVEVAVSQQATPVEDGNWDHASLLEYFKKLTPQPIVMFNALTSDDRSTSYLKTLCGFKTEHEVAGALSWPARHAYEMGKPLPWSYDGDTVKMIPEFKALFREALDEFLHPGPDGPGRDVD